MKFYYTGAPTYNAAQQVASLSLGKFLSSSQVQNDILNNLFSNLSDLTKQNLSRQAILVALKNDHNEVVQGVTLKFDTSDWSKLTSEFKIAFVASKVDACGDLYFDGIENSEALPYLTFETISELNNEFLLADMARDEVIGIWLIRKVLQARVASLACGQLYANYTNVSYTDVASGITYTPSNVPTEEEIAISLEWSDDNSGSISS